jgi:hypothetical protein
MPTTSNNPASGRCRVYAAFSLCGRGKHGVAPLSSDLLLLLVWALTMDLKLFVYVIGLGSSSFSVRIRSSETVDDLKEAILKKKSHDLASIDADRLTLYRVTLPSGGNLEQAARDELAKLKESGKEGKEVALDPTEELSACFDDTYWLNTPRTKRVHVLVEIPDGAGECLESRTRLKRLIECFIHCFILNFPGWSLPHLHLHIHEPPLILSHTFVHFLILAHRSLKLAFTFPAHTPFHDRQTCLLHPNPTYLSPRSPHPSRITLTVGS